MISSATTAYLNGLDRESFIDRIRECCGSTEWSREMERYRPFGDGSAVHQAADHAFDRLSDSDWIEAFQCHPKLGDLDSLKLKFAGNRRWSASEQASVVSADESTLRALADGNTEYQAKFGFIFILCASGKSAEQMLVHLRQRLVLDPSTELRNAAREQRLITHLRIDKLESHSP